MTDSISTVDATKIAQALAVPFAAGFVVQRALEIVDPYLPDKVQDPNRKKKIMAVLSLGLALAFSFGGVRVFSQLGYLKDYCVIDCILSGIFISAGTEGFNSLLKFAGYKKEASKADAANKIAATTTGNLKLVNP